MSFLVGLLGIYAGKRMSTDIVFLWDYGARSKEYLKGNAERRSAVIAYSEQRKKMWVYCSSSSVWRLTAYCCLKMFS